MNAVVPALFSSSVTWLISSRVLGFEVLGGRGNMIFFIILYAYAIVELPFK